MRLKWIWAGCAVTAVGLVGLWQSQLLAPEKTVLFEPPVPKVESAPLCPWRDPESDLKRFFSGASNYTTETRILSGMRVELTKRLGRLPESEENAVTIYRVFSGSERLGSVLTRRVKGEQGAIEIALAINPRGEALGLRLQRMREPEAVANQLKAVAWLGLFHGRTHDRGWESDDVSSLPKEAQESARAIREGVRSLLVLQAASEGFQAGTSANHY